MPYSCLSCKRHNMCTACHQAHHDVVAWCFASVGTPVRKRPTAFFRSDGKRPDSLTLVPWQSGKFLCWDITVICPLAESYVRVSGVGAAAELAAFRIVEKTMPALEANISLRPSRSKPWARWIRRHTNCLPIWKKKISSASGDDGEGTFRSKSFGDGAALQRCIVTWHLESPLGNTSTEGEKNNNNNNSTKFVRRHHALRRQQRR